MNPWLTRDYATLSNSWPIKEKVQNKHRLTFMIIDLFNVPEVDHSHVGGKAYNLHKLYSAGLPVPNSSKSKSDLNNEFYVDWLLKV